MTTCTYTVEAIAFAEGELDGAEAELARDHLVGCDECQREVADAFQLAALPHPSPASVAPGRGEVVALDRARERARARRRTAIVAAAAATAAAAGVMLWMQRPPRAPATPAAAIALAPQRALEARLAWAPASAYRAYAVDRGAAPGRRGEPVPLAALAELDRAGDRHAVGALSLLAGDTERAATYLADGAGPDLDADRAALALARGDAEAALTLAGGVLAIDPTHPAARWNHALALRDLGLVRVAAEELTAIAASRDPRDTGWADEARARAEALTATADARAAAIDHALTGGAELVRTGAGLTADDARATPGLARLFLYDALRTAPDRARAAALRPLAEAIDDTAGGDTATRAVDRVAAADFAVRAPLARTFAELVAGTPLAPAARARFLARLRAADQPDLLIGAVSRLGADGSIADPEDVPDMIAAAAELGDPWLELYAIEHDATNRIRRGDLAGAEAELVGASARCPALGVPYRCVKLAGLLAGMYLDLRRFADAHAALVAGWAAAESTGDGWLLEQELIPKLANLHVDRDDARGSGLALVRAYGDELIRRRAGACDVVAWAHQLVALVLVNQIRLDDASRELAAGRCEPHKARVAEAFVLAHVVRAGGTDGDRATLAADLAALRADPARSPGERAMLDHIEGRAAIDRDPARGEALLTAAIRAADAADAADTEAAKARAYSYSVLALAAAARGDADRTLALLGDEARVVPGRCTLGLAVEDNRRVAVARGADGATVASYGDDRASAAVDPATLVPAAVLDRLTGCDVIEVIARAPLAGAPDVLPADRAWRYRAARPATAAPDGSTTAAPITGSAPHRVIVADTRPPAELGLPALAPWLATGATGAEVIRGATATPARVLASLRDATWVELHAHGVVASGASEASYLALSPDPTGRYALTARDVRAAGLRGAPIVVLAACDGARGAALVDDTWSLPAAFVAAGARAVIASDAPIPDADAAAVFADLRSRIEAGATPAVALRDVRTAWAVRGAGWVGHLMVFE